MIIPFISDTLEIESREISSPPPSEYTLPVFEVPLCHETNPAETPAEDCRLVGHLRFMLHQTPHGRPVYVEDELLREHQGGVGH